MGDITNESYGGYSFAPTDEQGITDALATIGAGFGTIRINANITLTGTILINGGGSYLFTGNGVNSVIVVGGDWTAFNIDAGQVTLQNFMIDTSDVTLANTIITDVSSNYFTCKNVVFQGDNNDDAHCIDLNASDHCLISECSFDLAYKGITDDAGATYNRIVNNKLTNIEKYPIGIQGDYCIIDGNIVVDNAGDYGIACFGTHSVVSNNICKGNTEGSGITMAGSYNSCTGNVCNFNVQNDAASGRAGIQVIGDNCNVVGNNCCGNTNSGAGTTYGIIIGAAADETMVGNNICRNNDTNFSDGGTNTTIGTQNTA